MKRESHRALAEEFSIGPPKLAGSAYTELPRRQMLALGATTVALASVPIRWLDGSLGMAEAATWAGLLTAGTVWLAKNVMQPFALETFSSWMKSRSIVSNHGSTFHDRFAYPVGFDGDYHLVPTPYGSYFGVDKVPVLTGSAQFEPLSDVNWEETNELDRQRNNPFSPLHTLGPSPKLLPMMTGRRQPASSQDHEKMAALIADVVGERNGIPVDPGDVAENTEVKYVRDFCTCVGPVRGYAARFIPTMPNPDSYRFRFFKV